MKPRGLIFGGFVNGLGLARSLAKEGIESDVWGSSLFPILGIIGVIFQMAGLVNS